MTMLACEQPGCGGTIDDGYCDACGLAPAPGHVAVLAPEAIGAMHCVQPGCGGTIEDGYCDTCGLAPAPGMASIPVSVSVTGGTSSMASTSAGVSRSASSGTGRGRLGAGLVEIPPVSAGDPATAVLADPQVPESQRFCGNGDCGQPVGRGSDGSPGRIDGFCKVCGTRFDFRPRLQRGDLVAGQYEVLGCLAHGGLGWIYLARDRNVSDRWVVLKGLLNSGDADAQAAAVAERRFLAEVEHPNIVRIYNFVQHADSLTGDPTGYIVMEYVGGKSLKQIRREHQAVRQALPVEHALAYAIEILPAFGYLHGLGLVYCDFKADNVMQVEEQLKLIDLGGVCRLGDEDSPIYGTVGYQAPEIAAEGPSPSSDLYTIGRALAVLTFEFVGYTSTYSDRLPDPVTVPVLAQHESFYRVLQRATHFDPRRRFTAAGDMAEQLTGVLREVLAARDGTPRPAFSARFTTELRTVGAAATADETTGTPSASEIVAGLPVPLADSTDPAAGYLVTLSTLGPAEQAEALQQAIASPDAAGSVAAGTEAFLALARARFALGDVAAARAALAPLAAPGRADWRVTWHEGLADLLAGRADEARSAFDAVYGVLPGELAPKLALGFAAEATGDMAAAARYFGVVWATDRSYVSAAFGLARIRLAAGDRAAAVSVLGQVPETSTHHLAAQLAAVRALITGDPAGLSVTDVTDAGRRLERLRVDAALRHSVEGQILRAALDVVQAGNVSVSDRLLDCELTDRGLRLGMERSYRALARLAGSRSDRIGLVDLANDIRPRTLT
jgi:serine/threonine-protein kinase PknG